MCKHDKEYTLTPDEIVRSDPVASEVFSAFGKLSPAEKEEVKQFVLYIVEYRQEKESAKSKQEREAAYHRNIRRRE